MSPMGGPVDDRERFEPGFGHGGVPWYLMVMYLAFVVFFTWYVLEYQLPDYLEKGPVKPTSAVGATR